MLENEGHDWSITGVFAIVSAALGGIAGWVMKLLKQIRQDGRDDATNEAKIEKQRTDDVALQYQAIIAQLRTAIDDINKRMGVVYDEMKRLQAENVQLKVDNARLQERLAILERKADDS